jgi:hypothetical protein
MGWHSVDGTLTATLLSRGGGPGSERHTSKDVADNVLQFGMEDLGVNRVAIATIYEAVHLAGQSSWNENARLKSLGEKRILSVFPEDPRSRWNDWKKDPAHFK